MLSVTKQNKVKLHWLQRNLPEGLVVDAAWMTDHGYSTALRSQYVAAGWLSQPARRVYQRHDGPTSWQQVVISLQTLLGLDLIVGGISALEHHGFAHFVRREVKAIHLSGRDRPPSWLNQLPDLPLFIYRDDYKLFDSFRASTVPHSLKGGKSKAPSNLSAALHVEPWGPWNWPLVFATPERAILELINELPDKESFHQVDMIMDGLTTLSPRKLNALLADCRSIKVKRLFLYFADRHNHAWGKHLDLDAIALGSGKRSIVKGGVYDAKYQITVPTEMKGAADGV